MFEEQEKLSAFHQGQILTEGYILVREDICDWIVTLFQSVVIRGDTFLTSMHTGVLLCDLLQRIYKCISPGKLPKYWPQKPPNADRRATPFSFKARDNVSQFLKWCRDAGFHNTILFETKGLMNSDEEKNVVLTLLRLGEACIDLEIPVPQFAQFKKEIDIAQLSGVRHNSVGTITDHSDVVSIDSGFTSARSMSNLDAPDSASKTIPKDLRPSSARTHKDDSDKVYRVLRRKDCQPRNVVVKSNIRALKRVTPTINGSLKTRSKSTGALQSARECCSASQHDGSSSIDVKVREISRRCCCETKFQIERTTLHEGMYRFGTKNIFVRMFKDNVMLRIGGGWETLNEYLDKVDPCCMSQTRRRSTSSILSTSLTAETMNPQELRKFSQVELTKVKRIAPERCLAVPK